MVFVQTSFVSHIKPISNAPRCDRYRFVKLIVQLLDGLNQSLYLTHPVNTIVLRK